MTSPSTTCDIVGIVQWDPVRCVVHLDVSANASNMKWTIIPKIGERKGRRNESNNTPEVGMISMFDNCVDPSQHRHDLCCVSIVSFFFFSGDQWQRG